MDRASAYALLIEYVSDPSLVRHCMAVEAARQAAEGGEAVALAVDAMKQIADKIGILNNLARNADRGWYVSRTALDKVERITAYRRVTGYPFTVYAGLSTDEYLGAWYRQAAEILALVALLAGLTIGKAWERYKLRDGTWIDRRRVRESPHYILGLNFLVTNQIDLAIEELTEAAVNAEEIMEQLSASDELVSGLEVNMAESAMSDEEASILAELQGELAVLAAGAYKVQDAVRKVIDSCQVQSSDICQQAQHGLKTAIYVAVTGAVVVIYGYVRRLKKLRQAASNSL